MRFFDFGKIFRGAERAIINNIMCILIHNISCTLLTYVTSNETLVIHTSTPLRTRIQRSCRYHKPFLLIVYMYVRQLVRCCSTVSTLLTASPVLLLTCQEDVVIITPWGDILHLLLQQQR